MKDGLRKDEIERIRMQHNCSTFPSDCMVYKISQQRLGGAVVVGLLPVACSVRAPYIVCTLTLWHPDKDVI